MLPGALVAFFLLELLFFCFCFSPFSCLWHRQVGNVKDQEVLVAGDRRAMGAERFIMY